MGNFCQTKQSEFIQIVSKTIWIFSEIFQIVLEIVWINSDCSYCVPNKKIRIDDGNIKTATRVAYQLKE